MHRKNDDAENRRRRCQLYGSGIHAVNKIKSRSKPLLGNAPIYKITPEDHANVQNKLKNCFNLIEFGVGNAVATIDDKQFITLAQLLSNLECLYRLKLTPGELSVLVQKYDCVEVNEQQINYSKFLKYFQIEINKLRNIVHAENAKELEHSEKIRKKHKLLDIHLFRDDLKVDRTSLTVEHLASALENISIYVKESYVYHQKDFYKLMHKHDISVSLNMISLRDFMKVNFDCLLSLEESQAIISQFQGVSGGNADNIPVSFILHQCKLLVSGTRSAFQRISLSELENLNKKPVDVTKTKRQQMEEAARPRPPLYLPVKLPEEVMRSMPNCISSPIGGSPVTVAGVSRKKQAGKDPDRNPLDEHYDKIFDEKYGAGHRAGAGTVTEVKIKTKPVYNPTAREQYSDRLNTINKNAPNAAGGIENSSVAGMETNGFINAFNPILNRKKLYFSEGVEGNSFYSEDGYKKKSAGGHRRRAHEKANIYSSNSAPVLSKSAILPALNPPRQAPTSKSEVQNMGLLQKLNSTMRLLEASYGDETVAADEAETVHDTQHTHEAHGGNNHSQIANKHVSLHDTHHGAVNRHDALHHSNVNVHHSKSETMKKHNVLSKIQRALKANYEKENGSDDEEEELGSERRGKKVMFNDAAFSPQKLSKIPTNVGHRMLRAGGNMAIIRAKTPMTLTRAVNPSQERPVINSLISKSSSHSSDSMLGKYSHVIEYGGGSASDNIPLYVLPDMGDVKSIAEGGPTLSQYSLDEKTNLLRYQFRWQTIGKVVRYMKKEPLMISAFMKIIYKTMHEEIREYADAEVLAEAQAESLYAERAEKKRLRKLKLQGGMVSAANDFADLLGEKQLHDDEVSVSSSVENGSNASLAGDDSSSMTGSNFLRRNKKKVTLSYTNKTTGNWVSRDTLFKACKVAFKGAFSDGSIQQFISSLDPYRINVVSLMQLSGLLYCFAWADRSVRTFEKSFLNIHHAMDEPKVESKPVSDETKEQKIAAEIADPTLSLKAHSNNFTEHELSKLEVWYKMKTSKTPGVSIVSRLLYGATLELIKSINKKYFNREIVEYLFCSICTSQAAEAQVQKLIKPALGYVMTLRNRRIDAHHHAYSKNNRNVEEQAQIIPSDELLIELSLIKDDFFTIEHVMQIVIEDMHDIGSILLYEYESAFGQMNLQYNS